MRPVHRIGNRLARNPLPRPQGLVSVGIILDESPLFKPYAYTNGIMHYPSMKATPVTYRKVLSQ